MKKVISLLVMTVVVGLSGCMDPQDGTSGKLPAKEVPKVITNIAL